ncbi:MAG TPA: hypothetical protein VF066_13180 [Thermoleophilaceae bacterium]
MNSQLNFAVAQEQVADMRRSAAASRRLVENVEGPKDAHVIALRMAGADESRELRELAQLDSERPLTGDAIVALVDGRLVAAISLVDGRLIADPLVPTADARALLRQRAEQLSELRVPRRRRRFRPRFA